MVGTLVGSEKINPCLPILHDFLSTYHLTYSGDLEKRLSSNCYGNFYSMRKQTFKVTY